MGRDGMSAAEWARRARMLGRGAPWEQTEEVAKALPRMLWDWGRENPEEAWVFCEMAGSGVETMGDALACGFAYWGWCAGSNGAIPFFSIVSEGAGAKGRVKPKVDSAFDLPRRWPMPVRSQEIAGFAQDALGQAFARMDWSLVKPGRVEGMDTAPLAWARWRPDRDDFEGQDWGKLAGWMALAMEPAQLRREALDGSAKIGAPRL